MPKENLVAIIVLNHNGKEDVLECLESIYSQDYKEYEVFVVDNASTDDSVKAIITEYPSVHLIKNESNLGAGPGRNAGWHFVEKKFDYKYLLFLDDDVILEKNFITRLIGLFINNAKVG